jgi:hypothetical protein
MVQSDNHFKRSSEFRNAKCFYPLSYSPNGFGGNKNWMPKYPTKYG